MYICTTMGELVKSLLQSHRPDELESDMIKAMHTVEKCRQGGADNCYLIIAETVAECERIIEEHGLQDFPPETEETITAGGESWRKRVYVTDDAGGGAVLYSPA